MPMYLAASFFMLAVALMGFPQGYASEGGGTSDNTVLGEWYTGQVPKCAEVWGQCHGPAAEQRAPCCTAALTCVQKNIFYAQCVPSGYAIPGDWMGTVLSNVSTSSGSSSAVATAGTKSVFHPDHEVLLRIQQEAAVDLGPVPDDDDLLTTADEGGYYDADEDDEVDEEAEYMATFHPEYAEHHEELMAMENQPMLASESHEHDGHVEVADIVADEGYDEEHEDEPPIDAEHAASIAYVDDESTDDYGEHDEEKFAYDEYTSPEELHLIKVLKDADPGGDHTHLIQYILALGEDNSEHPYVGPLYMTHEDDEEYYYDAYIRHYLELENDAEPEVHATIIEHAQDAVEYEYENEEDDEEYADYLTPEERHLAKIFNDVDPGADHRPLIEYFLALVDDTSEHPPVSVPAVEPHNYVHEDDKIEESHSFDAPSSESPPAHPAQAVSSAVALIPDAPVILPSAPAVKPSSPVPTVIPVSSSSHDDITSTGDCAPLWGSCHGSRPANRRCCAPGLHCVQKDPWYGQCRPVSEGKAPEGWSGTILTHAPTAASVTTTAGVPASSTAHRLSHDEHESDEYLMDEKELEAETFTSVPSKAVEHTDPSHSTELVPVGYIKKQTDDAPAEDAEEVCASTYKRCGGISGGCCKATDACITKHSKFAACRPRSRRVPDSWDGTIIE